MISLLSLLGRKEIVAETAAAVHKYLGEYGPVNSTFLVDTDYDRAVAGMDRFCVHDSDISRENTLII
jgi:hypothetical protein